MAHHLNLFLAFLCALVAQTIGCIDGGIKKDLTSCSHYLLCEQGVFKKMPCSAGLHFNEKSGECEHPDKAGCVTSDVCSEGQLRKYLPSCSYYLICYQGAFRLMPCPEGYHYNENTGRCEYPDQAQCEDRKGCKEGELKKDELSCSHYHICEKGSFKRMICGEGLHFNDKTKGCDRPEKANCEPDHGCTEGVLKKDPIACTHYLYCEQGRYKRVECPEGSHFDVKNSVCDFPDIAGCEIRKRCPEGDSIKDSTTCTHYMLCVDGYYQQMPCRSGLHFNELKKICEDPESAKCEIPDPDKCMHGTRMKDHTNCKFYYECSYGVLKLMECSSGLHFNDKQKKCDLPENAGCEDVSPTPTPKCIEGDVTKDASDCAFFYQCLHGTLVHMQCPKGLHFSVKKGECRYPEDAGCSDKKYEECALGGVKKDFISCSFYYTCDNGKYVRTQCPDGLHFHLEEKKCNTVELAQCAL